MGTYFHSLLGNYSLNTSLLGYLIVRYAVSFSLSVFWQWLHYRSLVLYVWIFNRSRIIVLSIFDNRLVIIWVFSVRRNPCPGPLDLFEWMSFGASCVAMQSPGTCSKLWWLYTLRSCAVVLTTEPHVRPSHSFVVHPHACGRSKTFIRCLSGKQAVFVSNVRRCQMTCASYLLIHGKQRMKSNFTNSLSTSSTMKSSSHWNSFSVWEILTTRFITVLDVRVAKSTIILVGEVSR